MDIRVWGTRGSLAKPGRITLRHGGNTSCVEVRGDDGTLIVVVVLLLLFGGVGYGYRGSWGGYYGGGLGPLGLILIILFVVWLIRGLP